MITAHPRYAMLMTLVNALIVKIQLAQASYFSVNQKFFQGIRIPEISLDGTTDTTVNWAVAPHDQAAAWKDFDGTTFKTAFKIPFNIRIDVYRAPTGWGWVLTVELWHAGMGPDAYGTDGDHWVYKHHEGPANQIGYFDEWYIESDLP